MQKSLSGFGAIALAAMIACGASFAAVPEAAHPAVQTALANLQANPALAQVAAGDAFSASDMTVDADGAAHVHFQRTHEGLRVIGGDLVTHSDAGGALTSVTHRLQAPLSLSTAPTATQALAEKRALAQFGGAHDSVKSDLVIYARDREPVLAYEVFITGRDATGFPSEAHIFLDAQRLRTLDRWDDVQPADAIGTGQSLYSGTVTFHTTSQSNGTYALTDSTRGNHSVYDLKNVDGGTSSSKGTLMTDPDDTWGDGKKSKTSQSDGVDAMYGQNKTWDFYQTTFNRNGIANDGRGAYSRVHSKTSQTLYNAFWSDNCFCMTYTSGLSKTEPALLSLDVAGHEMTHGVTANTAGLVYSRESGGLNEGTSDIMGTMVEFFANNPKDPPDYTMGEQMGTPLRYMYHPSIDGASADCWYSAVGNLNVHYSSGVANHLFFLLAEGTASATQPKSPTCKSTDTRTATGTGTLAGIGHVAAQAIWYRALTVYFTSTTNYSAARAATLKAAADLYGGTGSSTYAAVAAAWTAVNVTK